MTTPQRHDSVPRTITFEQTHMAGFRRVRIEGDGTLTYEREWSGQRRALQGRVDVVAIHRVLEALDRTSFPEAPQTTFLPGSSCKITVDPVGGSVLLDYFSALELDGYGEVVRDMDNLNQALDRGDQAVLDRWKFQEESAR